MIASMTGYAALTGDLPQGALQLEIKSVNSRFLDIQFRIGEELRSLEPALRELIAAQVTRGKVDCRLGFTPRPTYLRSTSRRRQQVDDSDASHDGRATVEQLVTAVVVAR